MADRFFILGANPDRQPDADYDSPSDLRTLGRNHRAGARTGGGRRSVASGPGGAGLRRDPGALFLAAATGRHQTGRALLLLEHPLLYRPHADCAVRMVGTGFAPAAHRRPRRPAPRYIRLGI